MSEEENYLLKNYFNGGKDVLRRLPPLLANGFVERLKEQLVYGVHRLAERLFVHLLPLQLLKMQKSKLKCDPSNVR